MTITFDGSWQKIVPSNEAERVLIQNPLGNADCFVTQRIGATGIVETDFTTDPGSQIIAEASINLNSERAFWIKGTATQSVRAVFFA